MSRLDPRTPGGKRQGLTPAQFDALLDAQHGVCAICQRGPDGVTWVVDHDHLLAASHGHPVNRGCPKCVRGITHMKCNSAIGVLGDDPKLLRRAAAYVEHLRKAVRDLAPAASVALRGSGPPPDDLRGVPVASR
jgi:hypothetical protein